MSPHVWDIRCGLHRLFTVISNNQIDIMQIRGDIQQIPSIGLLGAASECFYVDTETMPGEIFLGHSPSQNSKAQVIPDSESLRIYYFVMVSH